jgi:SlyX protein
MQTASHTDQRLTALEVKASFAEDLLEEVNHTVFRQQQQIEQLARELVALRRQMPRAADTPSGTRDEVPPHY